MKILLYFCMVLLLVSPILAQELEIELRPIYFSQGYEVTYTTDIEVSGIKFEVIGTNNNQTSRILDIMILDSNIDFPNETKGLRIRQTKSIFISDLITINQTNITYFVKVFGFNEKTDEIIYANDSININIEYKEPESFLNEVGESIWESNPPGGLFVGGVIVFCTGIVLWKYEMKDYLNTKSLNWKAKNAQKRREEYGGEEGF